MELPQIDAASCATLVTLILWAWTRLKLPLGCHYQEASFRRQSYHSYWAFGSLIALEHLPRILNYGWTHWFVALASGIVFFLFALASFRSGPGFWSKRRNQLLSIAPIFICCMTLALMIQESFFIPMFGAFALGHLSHKKYVQMVYSSIQDLETLHAKVLKQEATHANIRHFENLPLRPTSQQA